MIYDKEIINYIRNHFPNSRTEDIAKHLNLSTYRVRKIAKENSITKSDIYLQEIKLDFIKKRRVWYEKNIPSFRPTFEQEQIIFGSIFGDGYISKGAQRSINYYYQEHFGESQRAYREWKLTKLKSLGFSINGNYLRSTSHPYFTKLYPMFYKNNIKIINRNILSRCTDPLFLTSLYLDDGSLVMTYRYNSKMNIVYCNPCIIIYTLNFTKEENQLFAAHLNSTFNTNFVVSGHPDGHGSLLKLNKEKEITHFLNIINPYASEIPSMFYKMNLNENIKIKIPSIKDKFGENVIIKAGSSNRMKVYSKNEIEQIIHLKNLGYTDEDIANQIGRSYWSVVYKLSELRKSGLL